MNEKVLHVIPSKSVGGIFFHSLRVSKELNNNSKYDNVIVAPSNSTDIDQKAKEKNIDIVHADYSTPTHFNSIRSILSNLFWFIMLPVSITKMYHLYKEQDPDIVHIYGVILIQPAIASWLYFRSKTVWYLVSDLYPKWLLIIVMPLVNYISDKKMLVSEDLRQYYFPNGKYGGGEAITVPAPVDISDIDDDPDCEAILSQYHALEADMVLVTIGKVNKFKNQSTVIEAIEQLDLNICYLIVGPINDREYANHLRKKGDEINQNVHVTGYVDNPLDIINCSDTFILTSVSEGTPISIMEAMALGKPVIASNIGGIPDMLLQGNAGILVDPHSAEDVANGIRQLFESPETVNKYSKKGKEVVQKRYTPETIANKYSDIYQNL